MRLPRKVHLMLISEQKQRRDYAMYIIGLNDAGFEFTCRAYTADQAMGYAKHLYGVKIKIRNIREIV